VNVPLIDRVRRSHRWDRVWQAVACAWVVVIAGLLAVGVVHVERLGDEACVADRREHRALMLVAETLAQPLVVPGALGPLQAAVDERNRLFAAERDQILEVLGDRPEC
jgi:hypothetical protein